MSFSSASAIRDSIGSCSGIRRHVPPSVFQLLQASYGKSFPVNSGDFSLMLKYRLLLEKENGFAHYQDVTTSLSGKIKKHLYDYENFEQFCSLLKSREITHSRISRCLTHILLGITSEKTEKYTEKDYVFYARILGFRREAAPLFGILKANASLPLISKLADASPLLDETGLSMLEDDIRSAHIYDSVACHKFQASFINEYSRQLVIL